MPEGRVAVFDVLEPSALGDQADEMSYDSVRRVPLAVESSRLVPWSRRRFRGFGDASSLRALARGNRVSSDFLARW